MKLHRVWLKERGRLNYKEFSNYAEAKNFYETTDTAIAFYPYDKKLGTIALVATKDVRR